MQEFVTANAEWLTVFQLPAYALGINPTEGSWPLAKCGLGNLAAVDLGEITRAVKHRLGKIQYRGGLVEGRLVGTGPSLRGGEQTSSRSVTGSGTAASPIEPSRYRRAACRPG